MVAFQYEISGPDVSAACMHACTLQISTAEYQNCVLLQVEDNALIERVTGRRLDPETGTIYHIKHSPPPKEIEHRLVLRSDDNAEALKARLATHHKNVTDVVSHYSDVVSEVRSLHNMRLQRNCWTMV